MNFIIFFSVNKTEYFKETNFIFNSISMILSIVIHRECEGYGVKFLTQLRLFKVQMSFTLVCVFINSIHKEQYDWEMVVNYAHTSRGCTISDTENNHYQACPTFNSSLQSFQGSYGCSPTQLFPLLFTYLFFSYNTS